MTPTANPYNPLLYPLAFDEPRIISDVSAWIEHIPFAFALVQMLRPSLIVELGAHKGDSYCAMCQATQTLATGGRCVAVDTWQGDPQAGHYGDEVLRGLRAHHDPLYAGFSRLLQTTFDAAVGQFADGSIDLLHIDGLHTYEAVRHDFETWLPKVSGRGVVLFHDTQERQEGFGVWRFWAEVSAERPGFEFRHGHGLGVLMAGDQAPEGVRALVSSGEGHADAVRRFYATLGRRFEERRRHAAIASEVFRQQQVLNEWRVRLGQMVPAKAADPNAAALHTADFLAGQAKDIETLVIDDLRLRQRLGVYPAGPIALGATKKR